MQDVQVKNHRCQGSASSTKEEKKEPKNLEIIHGLGYRKYFVMLKKFFPQNMHMWNKCLGLEVQILVTTNDEICY